MLSFCQKDNWLWSLSCYKSHHLTTMHFYFHFNKTITWNLHNKITIVEQLYIGEQSVSSKEFSRFFKTFGSCTFHSLSCWEILSSEKISQGKRLSQNFWKKKCISFIGAAEEEMKEIHDTMIYKMKIVNCSMYMYWAIIINREITRTLIDKKVQTHVYEK